MNFDLHRATQVAENILHGDEEHEINMIGIQRDVDRYTVVVWMEHWSTHGPEHFIRTEDQVAVMYRRLDSTRETRDEEEGNN